MLGVKKIDLLVALIFIIYVKFLNKFIIVLLVLPPLLLTTLFSLALNAFGANPLDNLVVFNREVSSVAINYTEALNKTLIEIGKANKYLNISY